jgi:hypothetical protein
MQATLLGLGDRNGQIASAVARCLQLPLLRDVVKLIAAYKLRATKTPAAVAEKAHNLKHRSSSVAVRHKQRGVSQRESRIGERPRNRQNSKKSPGQIAIASFQGQSL